MSDNTASEVAAQRKSLAGIGGWLVFPLAALFWNTAVTLWDLYPVAQNLPLLATLSGSFGLITVISITLSIFLIWYSAFCIVQFFRKRKAVPKMMIFYFLALLGITIFESGLVIYSPQFRASAADLSSAWKELFRMLVAAGIWVPYFLMSKRVQETFVN